jgi:hypothetical protein
MSKLEVQSRQGEYSKLQESVIEIDHLLLKKIMSLLPSTLFPPTVFFSNNKRIRQPNHSLRIDLSRRLVIMLIYRLLALVQKRILDRDNAQYLNLWFRHSISTNELRGSRPTSRLLLIRRLYHLSLRLRFPNRQSRLTKPLYLLSRLSTSPQRLLVPHLVRLPLLMRRPWYILSGTMMLCHHSHLVKELRRILDDSTYLLNYRLCHLVLERPSDKSDQLPSPQRLVRLIHRQQRISSKWIMSSWI